MSTLGAVEAGFHLLVLGVTQVKHLKLDLKCSTVANVMLCFFLLPNMLRTFNLVHISLPLLRSFKARIIFLFLYHHHT